MSGEDEDASLTDVGESLSDIEVMFSTVVCPVDVLTQGVVREKIFYMTLKNTGKVSEDPPSPSHQFPRPIYGKIFSKNIFLDRALRDCCTSRSNLLVSVREVVLES